jgi:hypothetical protein
MQRSGLDPKTGHAPPLHHCVRSVQGFAINSSGGRRLRAARPPTINLNIPANSHTRSELMIEVFTRTLTVQQAKAPSHQPEGTVPRNSV